MDSKWDIIQCSVKGYSHEKTGAPNQDAISSRETREEDGLEAMVSLSVADGHGGSKYFRSDKGSSIAVLLSVHVIEEFLLSCRTQSHSYRKHHAEERISKLLLRRWEGGVRCNHSFHPFTVTELETLEGREGEGACKKVEEAPQIAYGSTVLSVVVTKSYILYLQLGDGDLLTISDEGRVSRPFPKDKRLIGNETTSLCSVDAWKDVMVYYQVISDRPPALIMLATDGYANSFANDEDFERVGSDLLAMIRDEGIDYVRDNLECWLRAASKEGSGDDITVGLLYRRDQNKEARGDSHAIQTECDSERSKVLE